MYTTLHPTYINSVQEVTIEAYYKPSPLRRNITTKRAQITRSPGSDCSTVITVGSARIRNMPSIIGDYGKYI